MSCPIMNSDKYKLVKVIEEKDKIINEIMSELNAYKKQCEIYKSKAKMYDNYRDKVDSGC